MQTFVLPKFQPTKAPSLQPKPLGYTNLNPVLNESGAEFSTLTKLLLMSSVIIQTRLYFNAVTINNFGRNILISLYSIKQQVPSHDK